MPTPTPIIEMKNISKQFPGVKALDNVSFKLEKGSIHGLVGENGAGKSTLMKILSGTYAHYEGQVFYNGELIHFANEHDALKAGIAIVPQELSFVPELTVEENIFLGREPLKKGGILDKKRRFKSAQHLIKSFDLQFDPCVKMKELSLAQRQMIEIIKAISRNATVIIMDEPTSALMDTEVEQLYHHIHQLKSKDVSIIYISHKLEEIFKLCDSITVLRCATRNWYVLCQLTGYKFATFSP